MDFNTQSLSSTDSQALASFGVAWLQSAPIAAVITNREGTEVLFANEAAQKLAARYDAASFIAELIRRAAANTHQDSGDLWTFGHDIYRLRIAACKDCSNQPIRPGEPPPLLIWCESINISANDPIQAAVPASLPARKPWPSSAFKPSNPPTSADANLLSEQFEFAAELAGMGIARSALPSGRVYCDDRLYRIMGIEPRPEGLSIEEIRHRTHPDDLAKVMVATAQAMQSIDPVDCEWRFMRPDGVERVLLTRHVSKRDDADRTIEIISVVLDVTEQVDARNKQLELAERLTHTTEAVGVGLWHIELDTGKVVWNRRMFELYDRIQLTAAPTIDAWFKTMVYADDRDRIDQIWRDWMRSGAPGIDLEFRVQYEDGTPHWASVRARRGVWSGRPVAFGIHMDISQRRRTEEALRAAQERITLATRAAGIGVWERDLIKRESFWDEQMYALRGLPPGAGKPDELRMTAVHPHDREAFQHATLRAIRERSPYRFEFRVVWPDGTVRWIGARGLVLTDAHGKAIRMFGVNWDITDQKRAEDMQREKDMAERASQAKSEFLSRISHELRTPLNAILGFTQLLQSDHEERLSPAQRHRVERIHSASWHLLELINEILDLSRIEAGSVLIAREAVRLDEVIHEAMQWVEPMAQARQVTIRYVADQALAVWSDRVRLRQVLLNLLSNAVKYNVDGGAIDLRVDHQHDSVVLTVADTGRGMSDQQLRQLFEPFNRLGADRDGIEGTGIGLAIAHQLVENMSGTLEASSVVGQGSEFRLALTLAPADSVTASEPARPDWLAHGGGAPLHGVVGTVLYIEDNAINTQLIVELLKERPGIMLLTAADGQSGLRQALASPPDLLLIDLQLPDIDGFSVVKALREHAETRLIPCVAVSANAMAESIARAKQSGFADYWTKPLDLKVVLDRIDKLLKR